MSTATLDPDTLPPAAVSYPDLAREIGLTYRQRADILRTGLVKPVNGGAPQPGYTTWITPESAALVRQAKRIMDDIRRDPAKRKLALGLTVLTVLRLLISGMVYPARDTDTAPDIDT